MDPNQCSRPIPLNKGKIVGQMARLKLKEVWAVRTRLQLAERARDLALFNLGIYSIHSIRRTMSPLIYRRTKNIRAVQLLLGQTGRATYVISQT